MKRIIQLNILVLFFIAILQYACNSSTTTQNQVTSIKLDRQSIQLVLGETDSLIATITATGDLTKFPKTWTSSDITIVDIANDGSIIGLKAGTAIITVKSGDKTASCQVTVVDKIYPNLTSGELDFYGDYYKNGLTNNYVIYLTGPVDTLSIEINTLLSVKDSIPSGTYNVVTNLNSTNFSQFIQNTLVPGFSRHGKDYGSWFYNDAVYLPVQSGNLINSHKSGIYNISYNLVDSFGNTLSGSYRGRLPYVNASGGSYPVSGLKSISSKIQDLIRKQ